MLEDRYRKALRAVAGYAVKVLVLAWFLTLLWALALGVIDFWRQYPESRSFLLICAGFLGAWIVLGWLIPRVLRWIDRRRTR